MAAIHTLQCMGGTGPEETGGVALPKDDLRIEGLVQNGKIAENVSVYVNYEGDGEWTVRILEREGQQRASD